VTTRVALVGQHGVTRSSRQVRLAPHSVDWGGHVPLFPVVVPEIDANPELKKLNLYTRKHYCFLVVRHVGTTTARHARHDVRDTTRFTHRVVLWRDATSHVEFGLQCWADYATAASSTDRN